MILLSYYDPKVKLQIFHIQSEFMKINNFFLNYYFGLIYFVHFDQNETNFEIMVFPVVIFS